MKRAFNLSAARLAALAALGLIALVGCSGGADTQTNPITTPPPTGPTYTGPPLRDGRRAGISHQPVGEHLLDRVSTRILALDGKGGAVPYADYDQWEQGRRLADAERPSARPRPSAAKATGDAASGRPRKLVYLEQREWNEMEGLILEAEERLEACREAAADPAVAADHQALAARIEALSAAQAEVDGLYARWAELEAKARR